VTTTEQVSGDPDRLHALGENDTVPVPADWVQVIVSPVIVPLPPVTVAVQVELDGLTGSSTVVGLQDTEVLVGEEVVPRYSTTRLSYESATHRFPEPAKVMPVGSYSPFDPPVCPTEVKLDWPITRLAASPVEKEGVYSRTLSLP
jgi:hypothetical protein